MIVISIYEFGLYESLRWLYSIWKILLQCYCYRIFYKLFFKACWKFNVYAIRYPI